MVSVLLILALSAHLALGTNPYQTLTTYPDRPTIVHLFEWKWSDIARECEDFLQHYGYGAVQISPPNEHIVIWSPVETWWQRYQPVSYNLNCRSGNEAELRDMVQRCNKVGVRIIVDGVLNHMVGVGQNGKGFGGCTFNGNAYQENFNCVPFKAEHFNDRNCHTSDGGIHNWNDPYEVRKCRLSGLLDLDQSHAYVRQKMADYLNQLVDMGVGGFRLDAAKHIYPSDLASILGMVHDLPTTQGFAPNTRPFVIQEVADGGIAQSDYFGTGRVTNFGYGRQVTNAVFKRGQNFKYFGTFGPSWNMMADNAAANFIDNHDQQRSNPFNVLTYKNGSKMYSMGVAFMLAWTYGVPRVMSSYYFNNKDQGPPHNSKYTISSQTFLSDGTCDPESGWVCEHRWRGIRNLAKFRGVTAGQPVQDVATEDHRIAFRRGNSGFFALNNGRYTWTKRFQTGLASGVYCDMVSGDLSELGACTGTTVTVDDSGFADVSVSAGKTFAIHKESRATSGRTVPPGHPTSAAATRQPAGWQRTLILMHVDTWPGQNVFIRGGGTDSSSKIPIQHQTKVDPAFSSYTDWAVGDKFLDWNGAESGQGEFNSQRAEGTPLVWSTDNPSSPGYQPANHYGDNYWMVDLLVDCSQLGPGGYFQLKAFVKNGQSWENDVAQASKCQGTAQFEKPTTGCGHNHVALCGAVNAFKINDGSCTIDTLPVSRTKTLVNYKIERD